MPLLKTPKQWLYLLLVTRSSPCLRRYTRERWHCVAEVDIQHPWLELMWHHWDHGDHGDWMSGLYNMTCRRCRNGLVITPTLFPMWRRHGSIGPCSSCCPWIWRGRGVLHSYIIWFSKVWTLNTGPWDLCLIVEVYGINQGCPEVLKKVFSSGWTEVQGFQLKWPELNFRQKTWTELQAEYLNWTLNWITEYPYWSSALNFRVK